MNLSLCPHYSQPRLSFGWPVWGKPLLGLNNYRKVVPFSSCKNHALGLGSIAKLMLIFKWDPSIMSHTWVEFRFWVGVLSIVNIVIFKRLTFFQKQKTRQTSLICLRFQFKLQTVTSICESLHPRELY